MYSSTTKQKIEIISKRLESDILQTMAGGKASLYCAESSGENKLRSTGYCFKSVFLTKPSGKKLNAWLQFKLQLKSGSNQK